MSLVDGIKQSVYAVVALVVGILVLFYATIFWQVMNAGPKPMQPDDPAFQLVEGLLPTKSLELVNSYEVTGSWAGDIEEAFSARASGLTVSYVEQLPGIHRGDRLPPELLVAVEFAAGLYENDERNWLPSSEQITSPDYWVYPIVPVPADEYSDSTRLMILHPSSETVFYCWMKI